MFKSLLWRIPFAAACLTASWKLAEAYLVRSEAGGIGQELIVLPLVAALLGLIGVAALSPDLPKPFADVLVQTWTKNLRD
jgi:hypothetical protein